MVNAGQILQLVEKMMGNLKKTVMRQGMKLMSDPRVVKLMQDERVMKAVMTAMSVPSKVQAFTHEGAGKLAKAMALATEDEINNLRRTVRKLEEDVARLQRDKEGGSTPSKKKNGKSDD